MWLYCFSCLRMVVLLLNWSLNRVFWCLVIVIFIVFFSNKFVLGFGVLLVCICVSVLLLLIICLMSILIFLLLVFCFSNWVGIIWVLLKINRLLGLIRLSICWNCLWCMFLVVLFRWSKWLVVWFGVGYLVIKCLGNVKLKFDNFMENWY